MPLQVIVKGPETNRTYWVKSPMGGYLRLPKDEVIDGMANGTLQIYRPKPKEMERLKHLLLGEEQDE